MLLYIQKGQCQIRGSQKIIFPLINICVKFERLIIKSYPTMNINTNLYKKQELMKIHVKDSKVEVATYVHVVPIMALIHFKE